MKVSVRVRDRNILNYKVSVRYQSVKLSVRNVSVRFYLQPYYIHIIIYYSYNKRNKRTYINLAFLDDMLL